MRDMRESSLISNTLSSERYKCEDNRKQFNISEQIDRALGPSIQDNKNLIDFLKKSDLYNLV